MMHGGMQRDEARAVSEQRYKSINEELAATRKKLAESERVVTQLRVELSQHDAQVRPTGRCKVRVLASTPIKGVRHRERPRPACAR